MFIQPLKRCIEEHPFLNVIVQDKHTEKPFFERVSSINLEDHISIIHNDETSDNGTATLQEVLPPILDRPWPGGLPPWRIVVLPLPSQHGRGKASFFIAFAFSHTIGDGMTGLTFHRTFLAAWSLAAGTDETQSFLVTPPSRTLPPPFDTPERLPISWSFLLGPLIATYLPGFLAEAFGLRAAASKIDAMTWTGSRVFFDPETLQSRVRLLEIEAAHVQKALQASRNRGAKLTGVLHQLIVRALSKAIPNGDMNSFLSQTAVDMRGSIGAQGDTWGLFVSGYYEVHPRVPGLAAPEFSEEMWAAARSMTKSLSECTVRLQDQPVGLLRFAPSVRKWTLGKIGQQRDCSYEVSNLLAFDGGDNAKCKISKVVFAQPANVTGGPLVFNIVSAKGGSLMCAVSWQAGALGIPVEEEMPFVERICESLRADFESLGNTI